MAVQDEFGQGGVRFITKATKEEVELKVQMLAKHCYRLQELNQGRRRKIRCPAFFLFLAPLRGSRKTDLHHGLQTGMTDMGNRDKAADTLQTANRGQIWWGSAQALPSWTLLRRNPWPHAPIDLPPMGSFTEENPGSDLRRLDPRPWACPSRTQAGVMPRRGTELESSSPNDLVNHLG